MVKLGVKPRRTGKTIRPQRRPPVNDREVAARYLLANLLATRSLLPFGSRSNQIDQAEPDFNKECRYPENPDVFLFRSLIEREGIAQRINDVYPDESWAKYPDLFQTQKDYSTGMENRWNDFLDEMDPWAMLHRLDKLSGWGRYGGLLIGLNDGRDLDRPVRGMRDDGTRRKDAPDHRVIYMKPFSEDLMRIKKLESNRNNPRYGQPVQYTLRMLDPRSADTLAGNPSGSERQDGATLIDVDVHWHRVVHVADNRTTCDWAGTPRLLPVCNRIYDLRKILASSAEMFYKGGFPGYTFVTNQDASLNVKLDTDTIRDEVEDFVAGLTRYLASVNGEFKALQTQLADPSNHVLTQIDNICATISTPRRILMGTEAAHLASSQDSSTWNGRLGRRQRTYLNPYVIKPFVKRLMAYGALPPVKRFIIEWSDLNSVSDIDRAKIALTKSQAMMQYVSGKVETIMPLKQYFTSVLGLSPEEADAIIAARMEMKPTSFVTKLAWDAGVKAKPQGGGRNGSAPKKSPGRPRG